MPSRRLRIELPIRADHDANIRDKVAWREVIDFTPRYA
jgi:hypothetical protein